MPEKIVLHHFFTLIQGDERISVWHISLYIALLHLWNQRGCQNPIAITRKEVMHLAHINALATYHKCIKELKEFGYIEYIPSYNPFLGSLVSFKHL